MKTNNFAKHLSEFMCQYLPHERGASNNTIIAYRDSFVLFLQFMRDQKNVPAEKLTLASIDRSTIVGFLNWLQKTRASSNSTRNARLAAIHAFYRYVQYVRPDVIHQCRQILSVRCKSTPQKSLSHLSLDGIKRLLAQPDTTTKRGRRDLALLSLLYDTAARVQELIDLTPACLRLENPATVQLTGKGNKTRLVPMLNAQVSLLKNYLKENGLNRPEALSYPLFFNARKEKLTRAGVNHIVQRHFGKAQKAQPEGLPEKISCHTLRHSKAMHLLQAGVNLIYIRDILGHVSVQTTEVYARVDSKHKRQALEKAYPNVNPDVQANWIEDESLIKWLKSF